MASANNNNNEEMLNSTPVTTPRGDAIEINLRGQTPTIGANGLPTTTPVLRRRNAYSTQDVQGVQGVQGAQSVQGVHGGKHRKRSHNRHTRHHRKHKSRRTHCKRKHRGTRRR
jgi:hypothetical protein